MRRIILSSVSCLALPHFSKLSHKLHGFRGGGYHTQNVWFPVQFLPELFLILRRIQRDIFIHVHRSSFIVCFWRNSLQWARASSSTRFLDPTHHSQYDSSGRGISSSQRPLPYNTQHSQHTDIHAAGWIQTHNLSRRAAADLRLKSARPMGPAGLQV